VVTARRGDDNHRFRTALVFAKETGRPGQGFFDTVQNLRGKTILKSEQDKTQPPLAQTVPAPALPSAANPSQGSLQFEAATIKPVPANATSMTVQPDPLPEIDLAIRV
jgi:hypothetical protein